MESLSLEEQILQHLSQHAEIPDTLDFAKKHNVEHEEVRNVLKSLGVDNYVVLVNNQKLGWALTEDGLDYHKNGTPEYRLFQILLSSGGSANRDELSKTNESLVKFGMQYGLKKKWFAVAGPALKTDLKEVVDDERDLLDQVTKGADFSKDVIDNLKRRRVIEQTKVSYFSVTKGPNFQPQRAKKAADLTAEMLADKSWKTETFKPYNFQALGKEITTGNLHPLLKVRSEFRQILLEMGFEEMPTNNFVESSFWNFDSLFQPQQHPARDAHDTFFISEPEKSKIIDENYWQRVKTMHEKGDAKSIGWRYDWSFEEARKNILRTHTTAVSSRMLYKLAQEKEFKPRKWFSIDRVFRNESLDATHLAEFHQIEGLVVDKNLGLGHLLGIIRDFFRRIGITKLKFKPAYNPYTEPSMEIYGYHPTLKRWVEIGNSGVFRPEMLLPMGLDPDVSVVAWGLSVERPTMIQYNISNIRELYGHKVNLKTIKENPICAFK